VKSFCCCTGDIPTPESVTLIRSLMLAVSTSAPTSRNMITLMIDHDYKVSDGALIPLQSVFDRDGVLEPPGMGSNDTRTSMVPPSGVNVRAAIKTHR